MAKQLWRRILVSAALAALGATPAMAIPFAPGEMLLGTFRQHSAPPASYNEVRIQLFWATSTPNVDLTLRLYDGSTLLGTASSSSPFSSDNRVFTFHSASNPSPPGNSVLIDYSTFLAGTFDGRVEIETNVALDGQPFQQSASFGQSSFRLWERSAGGGASSLASTTPQVLGTAVVPVPEPESGLLVGLGVLAFALRGRSRRRRESRG